MKKYTWADYSGYRESFIADGMTPLPYIDWLRVQITADKEAKALESAYLVD